MSRMASSLLLLKALWMQLRPGAPLAMLGGQDRACHSCDPFVPHHRPKERGLGDEENGSRLAGCGQSFITEVPASLRSW
ncbi:hypothetical protein BC831DRAFT_457984 [Entophlyctis helioformis]|nr:hypothetical protein BC831DRAFT_457984 [Entophlyctis helioformis]